MASALIAGAIGAGTPASELFVVERGAAQRKLLEKTYGLCCLTSEEVAQTAFDAVVWAVKPQHMKAAIDELGGSLSALHISIAAGLPSSVLRAWLHSDRVIRTMPNSAATIGAGVTGIFARADISPADRARAEQLFSPTGKIIWVDSDAKIDAITAVSGSGPAYVFHFLEGFQAAAQSRGFAEAEARELALQTARGAVLQALAGDEAFSILRKRVTSEKGTTAAALEVLDREGTQQSLSNAVDAAFFRAQEIATELEVAQSPISLKPRKPAPG
jgi:pyrroline-5-carboxylate reductase